MNVDINLVSLRWGEGLQPELLLTSVLCLIGKPPVEHLGFTCKHKVVWDKALPRLVESVFPDPLIGNELRL